MGRLGPAFLAYPNFAAYTEWNNSLIYSTTAGYLASRIAGAAPMRSRRSRCRTVVQRGSRTAAVAGSRRLHVGKVDGVLGSQSRVAVKAMQVKYGLPADAWPTAELLARMRGTAPAAYLLRQACR